MYFSKKLAQFKLFFRNKFASNIIKTVQSNLDDFASNLNTIISAPINDAQALLDSARLKMNSEGTEIIDQISIYESAIGRSRNLGDELETYRAPCKISTEAK